MNLMLLIAQGLPLSMKAALARLSMCLCRQLIPLAYLFKAARRAVRKSIFTLPDRAKEALLRG